MNTKKLPSPNNNQSQPTEPNPNSNGPQPTEGFTWSWSITISEKVLLALIALISSFLTGFAIGNSQRAVSQLRELPPQSAIVSPPPAVNTSAAPELSTERR